MININNTMNKEVNPIPLLIHSDTHLTIASHEEYRMLSLGQYKKRIRRYKNMRMMLVEI